MRLVFFGTPAFAVPTLQELIACSYQILLIVTQPDRPKGRTLKISQSPVKQLAQSKGIQVLQPDTMEEPEFLKILQQLSPDLLVVVSYGKILPKTVLQIPRLYSLNLHASLLPKYRGASPIPYAILNGETKTGVTIIRMTEKMDAGDLLLQQSVAILPSDDCVTLSEKLSKSGAQLMISALELVKSGKVAFTPQDEAQATHAPRLEREDGRVDWSHSAQQIEALVRALIPWPSTYTFYQGKRIRIWKAAVSPRPAYGRFGQILKIADSLGIEVSTGNEVLLLQQLQPESRNRMHASEFARGYRLRPGDIFGE